jgi:hypothetical protein
MSYDTPDNETYCFPSKDFASTNVTYVMRGPKGKQGILRDVHFICTTTCAGATTTPIIHVGISGDTDKYCLLNLGTTAGGVAVRATNSATALIKDADGTPQILPADTDVHVVLVAATGGGAAGVGLTQVMIDWF